MVLRLQSYDVCHALLAACSSFVRWSTLSRGGEDGDDDDDDDANDSFMYFKKEKSIGRTCNRQTAPTTAIFARTQTRHVCLHIEIVHSLATRRANSKNIYTEKNTIFVANK